VSVFRPNAKDLRFEAELQAHPIYNGQWEAVRDILRRLRSAQTPADYYALHRELLNRFYALQQVEDECREHERNVRGEIKQVKAAGGGGAEVRPLSERLAGLKLGRGVASALRALYRDIGDALVWRLFRYQRPVIAALGRGEVVGRLSNEGLDAELNEIQGLWETRGVFALHADITSCVRHGDILAFDSLDPLRVHLTESKTRGRFNPDSAQGRRLQELHDLIRDGEHPRGAAGAPLQFARPGIEFASYHPELRRLIPDARERGYAWGELAPGLVAEVWDETKSTDAAPEENAGRHDQLLEDLGWASGDTIATSTALRRLRSRRLDHNCASLAPLSLAPLSLDDTADVIFGRLDVITTLHAPALDARLAEMGITAEIARGNQASETFLRATRETAVINVPATVREQVQIELMRLDTLVETISWFLDDITRRGAAHPNVDLFFEDEAAVWEAPASLT
jgi:hypothetical protein